MAVETLDILGGVLGAEHLLIVNVYDVCDVYGCN